MLPATSKNWIKTVFVLLVTAMLMRLYLQSDELDTASTRLDRLQFKLSRLSYKYDKMRETLNVSLPEDLLETEEAAEEAVGVGLGDDGRLCRSRKQVAFAKTHKAGSSTIQNILFRFGIKYNLTFALHPNSWMFSFKEPFNASVVLDGRFKSLKPFDLFVFHSIWNYQEMRKYST